MSTHETGDARRSSPSAPTTPAACSPPRSSPTPIMPRRGPTSVRTGGWSSCRRKATGTSGRRPPGETASSSTSWPIPRSSRTSSASAWVRPDDDHDRIGDIGVYLVHEGRELDIPGQPPDLMFEIVSPGKPEPPARLRREAGRVPSARHPRVRHHRPLPEARHRPDPRPRGLSGAGPRRSTTRTGRRCCRGSRSAWPRSCDDGHAANHRRDGVRPGQRDRRRGPRRLDRPTGG